MRIVIALGGNALLQRGQRPDSEVQEQNVAVAVAALAPLADHHELIVTHGNGPQVGVLAIESAADPLLSHPYPLDSLVAETQGLIGNWLTQELQYRLPGHQVATVVTQVVVDPADPAFREPTKFVGPTYETAEARQITAERGWFFDYDGGHLRRVVASPEPVRIVEIATIRHLVEAGTIVVCAGGGGIPVAEYPDIRGVEAVIDKDRTSALLAEELAADALLILTDIDGVFRNYGAPDAELIRAATPSELRAGSFPKGSMGPKIEAVCRFVERTGGTAAIGSLADAAHLLTGDRGTLIRPD